MRKSNVSQVLVGLAIVILLGAGGCAEGAEGGKCYRNGKCDLGLICNSGTCTAIDTGAEGGKCYGDLSCDEGYECSDTRYCKKAKPRGSARKGWKFW